MAPVRAAWLLLWLSSFGGPASTTRGPLLAAAAPPVGSSSRLETVRAAVQPILDELARKHNTSLSFGFAEASGTLPLAAGTHDPWNQEALAPDTLVPLGSVTKPWTALRVMQQVEAGRLSLDDLAADRVDAVLQRLFSRAAEHLPPSMHVDNASLVGLWGPQAASVTIGDLLGMTSGFADYNDSRLMDWTIRHGGDDMPPWAYLVSASRGGFVCPPRACASYSGANYVILGFVLVQLEGMWSWQDLNQMDVIPRHLWQAGRYRHTSFPKLGRCSQYPGLAHQFAAYRDPRYKLPRMYFNDLAHDSCLNGWTMGNIASTGADLATFFYDIFTLAPTGRGFVNATTLKTMTTFKPLSDSWCQGPHGRAGGCLYGMGFFKDQWLQDVFPMMNPLTADVEAVRLVGHPGEDWGSAASACGYNERYKFGVCVARTSATGMNCSRPLLTNLNMDSEVICKVYDAVLSAVGAPRLRCPSGRDWGLVVGCSWANQTPDAYQGHRLKPVRWMRPSADTAGGTELPPATAAAAAAAESRLVV